jgi:hypothetical protein
VRLLLYGLVCVQASLARAPHARLQPRARRTARPARRRAADAPGCIERRGSVASVILASPPSRVLDGVAMAAKRKGGKMRTHRSNFRAVWLARERRRKRTPVPNADELLSPGEVAKLAGVTAGAVRAWRLWFALPAVTLATRWHVFRRSDVERFLADRERRLDAVEATGRRLPPRVRKPKRRPRHARRRGGSSA